MTFRYPTSGFGALGGSSSTPRAASTSSWKLPMPSWSSGSAGASSSFPSLKSLGSGTSSFPSLPSLSSLKGATGNTLYPAPKTAGASSGFPSFSLPNRPSGGILGGAGQSSTLGSAPSWNLPLMSRAPSAAGAAPAPNLRMPSGFSSAALSGGAPPQQQQQLAPASAPPRAAPAQAQPRAAAPQAAASKPLTQQDVQRIQYERAAQQYGGAPKGPGQYSSSEEAAYHAGTLNNDGSYGKGDFAYDQSGRVYPVSQPKAAPAPRPTAPVAVGRPTQTHQPVIAPRPPTRDEIDTQNQGNWLA